MVTDTNHTINDISDANYGIPYIGAASMGSRNVFAMGLGRQDMAVSIEGRPVEQIIRIPPERNDRKSRSQIRRELLYLDGFVTELDGGGYGLRGLGRHNR